jgi:hypothetical protein
LTETSLVVILLYTLLIIRNRVVNVVVHTVVAPTVVVGAPTVAIINRFSGT